MKVIFQERLFLNAISSKDQFLALSARRNRISSGLQLVPDKKEPQLLCCKDVFVFEDCMVLSTVLAKCGNPPEVGLLFGNCASHSPPERDLIETRYVMQR
ncbi:hypothetical protein AVEN_65023-1 [Araneus ventricosus]|uniref:Uncharacterized protein n=1 Tax=Araneus ventricosus TaxID=182803 RepID=A0A4Y2RSE7_ARAVE|nr:hypothetical protein AVEN_65023-1 [Araneus ventricosus]